MIAAELGTSQSGARNMAELRRGRYWARDDTVIKADRTPVTNPSRVTMGRSRAPSSGWGLYEVGLSVPVQTNPTQETVRRSE